MANKFVKNSGNGGQSFLSELKGLLNDASSLDIAVSYLQVSGWLLLEPLLTKLKPKNIRLLFTDQMSITQPEALRLALKCGVHVRNYKGKRTYHPKIYLLYDDKGKPKTALIGSANISGSGLQSGIEAGVLCSEHEVIYGLEHWFDGLFEDKNQAVDVDQDFIKKYKESWKKVASSRIKVRQTAKKSAPKPSAEPSPSPEDLESLEDIFSTISIPIGILGIDHARNNVRTLARLLSVLKKYPDIGSKEKSELRLLRLQEGKQLTPLGVRASKCETEKELAKEWCKWMAHLTESELGDVVNQIPRNPRIASFRRAAIRFWQLKPEVQSYFFANETNKKEKETLMTIELLCSGSDVVCELSRDDFKGLSSVFDHIQTLPHFIREAVSGYWGNKGRRSWDRNDRSTMLRAWRAVSQSA
jgi:HKD family nuclease